MVIELNSGEARTLGAGYSDAGWSPDGRRIAAVENSGRHTRLFDAATLRQAKTLPGSGAKWSPDSRYLLRVTPCRDEAEDGTIEALDVETGRSVPIPSSHCMVYNVSTGWVSNRILPPPL